MQVSLEYNRLLSYVSYINQTPFLQSITLKNEDEVKAKDIAVKIQWDLPIVETWTEDGIELEAGESVRLNFEGQRALKVKAMELASMTEGFTMQFQLEVRQGDEIVFTQSYPVEVLAYNGWLGSNYHPSLIASFVTPNHPYISSVIGEASQILASWNLSFTAYQTQDKTDVIAQMKAIYLAIQKLGIAYLVAPPSFEKSGQRVRLPEEVLTNKQGNCIELSVLYASCLELVGLHPLLLFFEGHAMTGCWLEELTFPASIEDDEAALKKRIAKGVKNIEIVEATLLTIPQVRDYEEAVKVAEDRILSGQDFAYLLDIRKARTLGVRPLPQKVELENYMQQLESQSVSGKNRQLSQPDKMEETDDITILSGQKRSRLKVWESKLLNLTLRNNLLNFKPTKKTISILEGDINLLEDALSSGEEFSFVPCPPEIEGERRKEKEYSFQRVLKEEYKEYMNLEMKSHRLVSLLNEEDLQQSIKALYYEAKAELEENGANTLFLALGFLKWFETDLSKQPRYAPILLYPIELVRKSSVKGYVVRYREEEVQINTTLLEKLRMELNLELPNLEVLPQDEKGVDLQKILNTIRMAVLHKKGWDVVDISYVGLFSFNQFVMWNDIHNRSEELMANPIISSLMQGRMEFQTPAIVDSSEIDSGDLFFQNAVLMDADSSQLMAVYSASKGSSFVLHGPPGTGKSQTITNIIASALYNNKSVLFVAEKMAALSVVQSRLEKVGIGDFALELHSNKAKKGEVLAKLERVLEKQKNGEIKQIAQKRAELYKHRDEIKKTTDSLHKVNENGYSIYEMIAGYESQPVEAGLPMKELAQRVSKDYVQTVLHTIGRYLPLLGEVSPAGAHPFSFVRKENLSLKEREDLKELLSGLSGTLQERMALESGMMAQFGGEEILKISQKRVELFLALLRADGVLWYFVEHALQEEMDAAILPNIALGKQCKEEYEKIAAEFQEGFLEEDAALLLQNWNFEEQKWFLARTLGQNKLYKRLLAYAKMPVAFTKEKVRETLERVAEYQNKKKAVEQYMTVQVNKLGEFWRGNQTDWQALENAVHSTKAILEILAQLRNLKGKEEYLPKVVSLKSEWLAFRSMNGQLGQKAAELLLRMNRYSEDIMALTGGVCLLPEEALYRSPELCQRAYQEFGKLDSWLSYQEARTKLTELGLETIVSMVERGEISPVELKPRVTKSLFYYGVLEWMEKEKELTGFHHHNFEYLLEQYRKELKIVTEMTRLELLEKLIANVPMPQGDINANSEMGILKKAIKNGGRSLSLRKLFEMTPNILRKIAPCMLMSPISIAQYIGTDFPKFDLVIFDEASQVNTHSAVGAIARGSQLIVVGDPNQLPPTSFFKGNLEEEDVEFEEEDQQSILDECQAILFPELHLKWHYRSGHESLIAFSNAQYYQNMLYTFPSYNDLESKVSLMEVEGYYDRSGSKQNVAEAEAILKEVERRLSSEELRQETIGIVTFSSVQQKLIQTMLDDLFAQKPELEEAAGLQREELFVKNLENVQGDERDVILFSVGYGPDRNGKVSMNFGPLNHSEGWKRLNVVVSRSRNQMIVYSVLKPEQIDLSRTSALGVEGLKRFLEFARNKNSLAITYQKENIRKDELIEVIAAEIEKMGYTVVKQVGKSNYRIDIGVVNPKNPKEYLAAVLIDGLQYYHTPTVRDKTVVQPFMLKRLKWNTIRVWAVEWFKNKEMTVSKLRQELMRLEEASGEKEEKQGDTLPVVEKKERSNAATEFAVEYEKSEPEQALYYQPYPVTENQYSKERFFEPIAEILISQIMTDMIEWESPIMEEELFRKIMSIWGVGTLNAKVESYLKSILAKAGAFLTIEEEKTVVWKSEEAHRNGVVPRRFAGEKRKFVLIPQSEIEATILEVLREQVSLEAKDLCKEVFRFHGYTTLGEESARRVMLGLERLYTAGYVTRDGENYRIDSSAGA